MKKGSSLYVKIALILSLLVSLLAGCGSPNVKENYPLESVNRSGSSTSYVYRAAGEKVPQVAADLISEHEPDQKSPDNEDHMFLVYDKEYYHLQKDSNKPEDTLIEVDSEQYVRNNYDSSFLQGYLAASLIGSLFDSFGGHGSYRGYSSKDTYKPKQDYHAPTKDDKKAAPPLTVEKKGSITRRGGSGSSSGSVNGDNSSSGSDSSKGSITRNKDGGSSDSGSYSSPKKSITKPKTRSGSGGITRRRR